MIYKSTLKSSKDDILDCDSYLAPMNSQLSHFASRPSLLNHPIYFLSADRYSLKLLVRLSKEGGRREEEGRKEERIIFKAFGRDGRIEGLGCDRIIQY